MATYAFVTTPAAVLMKANRLESTRAAIARLFLSLMGALLITMPVLALAVYPRTLALAPSVKKGASTQPTIPAILRRRTTTVREEVAKPLTSLSHC